MPEVTVKQWCEALRSGKYEQGEGELHNPATHTFCCLGVLAALQGAPVEHLQGKGLLSDIPTPFGPFKLPEGCGYSERELALMNDGEDLYDSHTFQEIADILEHKMKPRLHESE